MITDKQYEDSITAAGMWFFLTQYDIISNWKGEKSDLIDLLYKRGFDSDREGTATRVNNSIRIIDNARAKEALESIRDSKRVNDEHPDAKEIAEKILASM